MFSEDPVKILLGRKGVSLVHYQLLHKEKENSRGTGTTVGKLLYLGTSELEMKCVVWQRGKWI